MAEFTNYKAGLGSVGSYQMGGIPFASSSITVPSSSDTPVAVVFPQVTKFVTVTNDTTGSNSPLRVGFSENGVKDTEGNKYYFVIDNGESYTGDWRLTTVYLLGDSSTQVSASVIAGVTPISTNDLFNNWSGSVGVG